MPRIIVKQPHGPVVKHGREFALLRQMDPTNSGVDSEKLKKYADRGDESKVKELAGKSEVSFEDFAAAFKQQRQSADEQGSCFGWAARDSSGKMAPYQFDRREMRGDDVRIQVTYCGMCHSDLHQIRNEWNGSTYPMTPGHECLGVVTEVGKEVKKFSVGDFVAVGCMVDSCAHCEQCKKDEEQFCFEGQTMTYNGKMFDGEITHGGYSTYMIVKEHFCFTLDAKMHRPEAAPLTCAGISVYSPMRYYGADKKGQRIAVNGLGGLGHMVVKFAKAFGQHVTVLSRSDKKKQFAFDKLGADAFLTTSDEEGMKQAAQSFDAVVDTVAVNYDLTSLLSLLKVDGKLIQTGMPPKSEPYTVYGVAGFILKRRQIGGSFIGGCKETQEMLDFCAKNDILCDVELVQADYINEAFKRMEAGDVHFRFVIDNLKSVGVAPKA